MFLSCLVALSFLFLLCPIPATAVESPLRPFPFQLVPEEAAKQFSATKDQMTVGTALGSPLSLSGRVDKRREKITVSGALLTDFSQFVTPFLSFSGRPYDSGFLADFFEGLPGATDFNRLGVFPKLSSQKYQDQLKNAMILRASANPAAAEIEALYGFKPATVKVHNYRVGSLTLSQLEPKPLDDPEALAEWEKSPTAAVWGKVPMFSREDTKGFIAADPAPGQTTTPTYSEAIHPHLARTYELASALSFLLPYQPKEAALAGSEPPPVSLYVSGSGDPARDGSFATSGTQTIDNPYYDPAAAEEVNDACGSHSACEVCDPDAPDGLDDSGCFADTSQAPASPVSFTTYTPFLAQISQKLLGGGGVFSAFNPGQALNPDLPGLGISADSEPPTAKFFYRFLGSIACAKDKTLAALQPFLGLGAPSPKACQIKSLDGSDYADSGSEFNSPPYSLPVDFVAGSCPIPNDGAFLLCGSYNPADLNDLTGCHHGSNDYWSYQNEGPCAWPLPLLTFSCKSSPDKNSVCYSSQSNCGEYGTASDFSYPEYQANGPVILPLIDGKNLHWTLTLTHDDWGSGFSNGYSANDGVNIYEIYLVHLNGRGPTGADSGDVVQTISPKTGNPHVHVELKINGTTVNVDNLCS